MNSWISPTERRAISTCWPKALHPLVGLGDHLFLFGNRLLHTCDGLLAFDGGRTYLLHEVGLLVAQHIDHAGQFFRAVLHAPNVLVKHRNASGDRLNSLEEFDRLLLQLGNALGVAGTLLGQKGNLSSAFLDLLGQAAQLVAHGHDQLAKTFIFDGPNFNRFFQTTDARQFTSHLADLPAQHLAIAQSSAFHVTLGLHPIVVAPIDKRGNLRLGILNRSLKLIESAQLGLRAGELSLKLLNAASLFDDVAGLAFDSLLQACDLGTITSMLFVEPVHHLCKLCNIHLGPPSGAESRVIPPLRSNGNAGLGRCAADDNLL